MRGVMLNRKFLLRSVAVIIATSIAIVWSEFHSTINEVLGSQDIDLDSNLLLIYILGVASLSILATFTFWCLSLNYVGAVKSIVFVNCIVFFVELLPALYLEYLDHVLLLYFVVILRFYLWPVLLALTVGANLFNLASIRRRRPKKTTHHDLQHNNRMQSDAAKPRR